MHRFLCRLLLLLPVLATQATGAQPSAQDGDAPLCPVKEMAVERLPDLNIARSGHSVFYAGGELVVAGYHPLDNFAPYSTVFILHVGSPIADGEQSAGSLGVSSQQVTGCLSSQRSTTFTGYVNACRVEHAKQLMQETPDKKLVEIYMAAGFSSERTFFRRFKAVTGMTPTEWML